MKCPCLYYMHINAILDADILLDLLLDPLRNSLVYDPQTRLPTAPNLSKVNDEKKIDDDLCPR